MRGFRLRSKPARIAIIVIVVSIGIASLAYFLPGVRELRTSFHEFSDQLVIGNYERAYQMTDPGFQAAMSEKDFVTQQQLLVFRHGALKGVSLWSAEFEWNEEGTSARLSAHFKYEHSTKYFDVVMKPYAGKWRIYGYREKE